MWHASPDTARNGLAGPGSGSVQARVMGPTFQATMAAAAVHAQQQPRQRSQRSNTGVRACWCLATCLSSMRNGAPSIDITLPLPGMSHGLCRQGGREGGGGGIQRGARLPWCRLRDLKQPMHAHAGMPHGGSCSISSNTGRRDGPLAHGSSLGPRSCGRTQRHCDRGGIVAVPETPPGRDTAAGVCPAGVAPLPQRESRSRHGSRS